jgi:type II secretory pathway pseudopilin PulG
MVEMAVVMAIAAIIAALAVLTMRRARPRANLATSAVEVQALLRGARQNAMSTGRNTIVLVFPQYQNPRGGVGRLVAFEDQSGAFFQSSASPNFANYAPDATAVGTSTELLETIDLPRGTRISTSQTGTLPAPYADITISSACGFCGSLSDGRGAVQYDSRGRATFHAAVGAALDVWGTNLSFEAVDPGSGTALGFGARTFLLTAATGGVRPVSGG